MDGSLNFEVRPKYSFIISANFTDGTVAMADVEVIVEDVNDVCPVFASAEYLVKHTEPMAKDLLVAMTNVNDQDTVGALSYSLSGDNQFRIDDKGRIYTNSIINDVNFKLDLKIYNLVATVSDGRCSHTTKIKVEATKILLNLYQFSEPYYRYIIGEEQARPFTVAQFQNVGGFPGKYSLLENEAKVFAINETSGVMNLVKELDYESQKRYYLRLEIQFDIGYKAQTTVIVEVRDDNDVRPDLQIQPSLAVITPNFPVDSLVTVVRAIDVDTEQSYEYSIISGDIKNIFIMRAGGRVKTRRCLTDADVNLYTLDIQVFDGKHRASRQATVKVIRSEDKKTSNNCGLDCREFGHPSIYTFTQGLYTKTMRENTPANAFVQQVRVPAFDDVTYTLSAEANGVFTIDRNGSITTLVPLDYEASPFYSFTVTAALPTPVTPQIANMQAGVIVKLENEDDESPILISYPGTVSVSDLAHPNAAIGCIKVTDKDTNLANMIYSLTGGNNLFAIDQKGEIRIKESLKASAGQNVSIAFEVSDGKNTPLSGSFDIIVVDENTEVPIFGQAVYIASLDETSSVGTIVTTLVATDGDTGSQVVYSLPEASTYFAINPSSGVVTLKSKLDYETIRVHEFFVSADDGILSSQAIIKVNVIDANDTAPTLPVNPIIRQMSEYALEGAPIVQIKVSDPDTNDVMTYSLTGGDLDIFRLDPSTGGLFLRKQLYQFRESEYTLPFTVRDSQNSAVQGEIIVKVIRSTVNPCPDFVGAHSIDLLENATVGTFVTSIRNQTENYYSILEYAIYDDSDNDMFAIDNNGKITLKKPLDYETHTIHTITVDAYDTVRKFNSTIIFFVKVTDVNEFAPLITSTSMRISEKAPQGTPVGTVSVTDEDKSSVINFSLGSDVESQAFAIDATSGTVTVNTDLNNAPSKSEYGVNVCASDGFNQACKLIPVAIDNVNDKAPVFGEYSETYVMKDPVVGKSVAILSASDADGGVLTYSFMNQSNPDTNKYFQINSSTGEVTIKEVPTSQLYNMAVCASDSIFKTCVQISIRVPSSTPVFDPLKYGTSIADDSSVDTEVTRVFATDLTGNSNIRYNITEGNNNNKFKIDALTGDIKIAKQENDGTKYFEMKVEARNIRGGSYSKADVVVALTPTSFVTPQTPSTEGDSLIVNFTLSDFDQSKVSHYLVIAEEVGPFGNNTQNADQRPVTYFQATTQLGYTGYPFIVAKIPKDLARRKRRAVSDPFLTFVTFK